MAEMRVASAKKSHAGEGVAEEESGRERRRTDAQTGMSVPRAERRLAREDLGEFGGVFAAAHGGVGATATLTV